MNRKTTKYVTMTVNVVFYGDYVDADEVTERAQSWLSSGMYDRDDVCEVSFGLAEVREVEGDPECYDG